MRCSSESQRRVVRAILKEINREKRPENIRDYFSVTNSSQFEINTTFLWSKPMSPVAHGCSLSGPLLYHSPVVFLDRGHPRFENFNVPVDVIRVKSFVDSFLDPTGVPVRVSINKLYLVPKRIMAGLVGVLSNG